MKKIIALIICTLAVVMLAACGGDPAETSDTGKSGGTNAPAQTNSNDASDAVKPVFVYNGVTIEMNALADDVIAALGDPVSTYESPSCAFQGTDINYNYGSIEITVYENEGERRIYSLFVKDDLVSTPEGLSIGSPESDAFSIYGDESKTQSGNIIYNGKGASVTVTFADGKVASIEYTATFD